MSARSNGRLAALPSGLAALAFDAAVPRSGLQVGDVAHQPGRARALASVLDMRKLFSICQLVLGAPITRSRLMLLVPLVSWTNRFR